MIDMLGQELKIGDVVAVPVGSELKFGQIRSLGKRMAVMDAIPGNPRSISSYRGGKRYFQDVIKVVL